MSQEQRLGYLQQLLHNLPESTGPYHDIRSTNYHFSVSDEEIEEYGDETSATNRRLEINFGPRHRTNGIVPIVERGPGICAVVSTLLKCPLDDVRVELWVNNLCSSAEKLYAEAGKKVRGIRLESYKTTHTNCSYLKSRLTGYQKRGKRGRPRSRQKL